MYFYCAKNTIIIISAVTSTKREQCKKSVVLYTTSLTEGPENNTCEEDAASVHAICVNRYTLLLLDEKFSGFQSQEEV